VLLVRQERHANSNDEAWATTWQVFWSTFVNTGVITLLGRSEAQKVTGSDIFLDIFLMVFSLDPI
jgi:hypothetical protein